MVHNKSSYKGNYVLYVKFGGFISERPPTDIRFLMMHHRVQATLAFSESGKGRHASEEDTDDKDVVDETAVTPPSVRIG